MHLVRHIELVKKYLTFDTRKSKTNMAKKYILEEQVHSDFDRNFGSSPPEVYWKYAANLKENTNVEIWFQ